MHFHNFTHLTSLYSHLSSLTTHCSRRGFSQITSHNFSQLDFSQLSLLTTRFPQLSQPSHKLLTSLISHSSLTLLAAHKIRNIRQMVRRIRRLGVWHTCDNEAYMKAAICELGVGMRPCAGFTTPGCQLSFPAISSLNSLASAGMNIAPDPLIVEMAAAAVRSSFEVLVRDTH